MVSLRQLPTEHVKLKPAARVRDAEKRVRDPHPPCLGETLPKRKQLKFANVVPENTFWRS